MNLWLLVYGTGGCYSGYPEASVLEAPDRESALSAGGHIASQALAGVDPFRGLSYDVEPITTDLQSSALYRGRLTPGGRCLAELAYNEYLAAHGR